MISLFEEHDHVVVDIEADVAVGLVLHGEATSEDDQTMPGLSIVIVKLRGLGSCFVHMMSMTKFPMRIL